MIIKEGTSWTRRIVPSQKARDHRQPASDECGGSLQLQVQRAWARHKHNGLLPTSWPRTAPRYLHGCAVQMCPNDLIYDTGRHETWCMCSWHDSNVIVGSTGTNGNDNKREAGHDRSGLHTVLVVHCRKQFLSKYLGN